MEIPKDKLRLWKDLKEQGDLTEMENMSVGMIGVKVYRQNISKALRDGICPVKTYQLLNKFYTIREKLIKR